MNRLLSAILAVLFSASTATSSQAEPAAHWQVIGADSAGANNKSQEIEVKEETEGEAGDKGTLEAPAPETSTIFAINLAQKALDKKDFASALATLSEAIEAIADGPENKSQKLSFDLSLLYLRRANVYRLFCNYRRAIADLDQALSLNAKLIEASLQKAICQARIGADCRSPLNECASRILADGAAADTIILTARGLYECGDNARALELLAALKPQIPAQETLRALIEKNPVSAERLVTAVDKTTTGFDTILPGRYFILYSDIGEAKAQNYLRMADGFISYFKHRFGEEPNTYPCGLFILHDKFAGRAFLAKKMNFPNYVHGVYMSGRNALVTYDGAGIGTLMHEIMHKYLSGLKLEYWAEEGIAAAFEKVYGFETNKIIALPHNGLPAFIAKNRKQLTLEQIVKSARHADPDQEDSQSLLGLFLLHEHKMERYLQAVRNKSKNPLAETFGKPIGAVEAAFALYLTNIMALQDQVRKLPPSNLFDSETDFNQFCESHGELIKRLGN